MTRKQLYLVLAAVAGVALLAWTIYSVGPSVLGQQLKALAPVLPLLIGLTASRFLLQAAGWRLALAPANRPPWAEMFKAVVAGEAAGYFAWGPVSREPMKAFLLGDRVPQREGLAAAIVERSLYTIVAAALILAAIGIVAVRYGRLWWFLVACAAVGASAMSAKRYWQRLGRIFEPRDTATILCVRRRAGTIERRGSVCGTGVAGRRPDDHFGSSAGGHQPFDERCGSIYSRQARDHRGRERGLVRRSPTRRRSRVESRAGAPGAVAGMGNRRHRGRRDARGANPPGRAGTIPHRRMTAESRQ